MKCFAQGIDEQANSGLRRPPAGVSHRVHLDNVKTHEFSLSCDSFEGASISRKFNPSGSRVPVPGLASDPLRPHLV